MKNYNQLPKDLIEQATKEDIETMLEWQKYLQVFKVKEDRKGLQYYEKANKTELKKADPETYYRALYRATFHMTTCREINGKYFFFKNRFLFD